MKSLTTPEFWECFEELPGDIQRLATGAFVIWHADPGNPDLRFRRIHADQPIFSLRAGRDCRAIGRQDGDAVIWFWIGAQAEYDQLAG